MRLTAYYTRVAEPHRRWCNNAPAPYDVLRGDLIDMGFENTAPGHEIDLIDALDANGLVIPDSGLRLRWDSGAKMIVVEPSDGTESDSLPDNWMQGVYTIDGNEFTWIGKLLAKRQDIVGYLDLSQYVSTPDGWSLP
jgi:hypothetical protein